MGAPRAIRRRFPRPDRTMGQLGTILDRLECTVCGWLQAIRDIWSARRKKKRRCKWITALGMYFYIKFENDVKVVSNVTINDDCGPVVDGEFVLDDSGLSSRSAIDSIAWFKSLPMQAVYIDWSAREARWAPKPVFVSERREGEARPSLSPPTSPVQMRRRPRQQTAPVVAAADEPAVTLPFMPPTARRLYSDHPNVMDFNPIVDEMFERAGDLYDQWDVLQRAGELNAEVAKFLHCYVFPAVMFQSDDIPVLAQCRRIIEFRLERIDRGITARERSIAVTELYLTKQKELLLADPALATQGYLRACSKDFVEALYVHVTRDIQSKNMTLDILQLKVNELKRLIQDRGKRWLRDDAARLRAKAEKRQQREPGDSSQQVPKLELEKAKTQPSGSKSQRGDVKGQADDWEKERDIPNNVAGDSVDDPGVPKSKEPSHKEPGNVKSKGDDSEKERDVPNSRASNSEKEPANPNGLTAASDKLLAYLENKQGCSKTPPDDDERRQRRALETQRDIMDGDENKETANSENQHGNAARQRGGSENQPDNAASQRGGSENQPDNAASQRGGSENQPDNAASQRGGSENQPDNAASQRGGSENQPEEDEEEKEERRRYEERRGRSQKRNQKEATKLSQLKEERDRVHESMETLMVTREAIRNHLYRPFVDAKAKNKKSKRIKKVKLDEKALTLQTGFVTVHKTLVVDKETMKSLCFNKLHTVSVREALHSTLQALHKDHHPVALGDLSEFSVHSRRSQHPEWRSMQESVDGWLTSDPDRDDRNKSDDLYLAHRSGCQLIRDLAAGMLSDSNIASLGLDPASSQGKDPASSQGKEQRDGGADGGLAMELSGSLSVSGADGDGFSVRSPMVTVLREQVQVHLDEMAERIVNKMNFPSTPGSRQLNRAWVCYGPHFWGQSGAAVESIYTHYHAQQARQIHAVSSTSALSDIMDSHFFRQFFLTPRRSASTASKAGSNRCGSFEDISEDGHDTPLPPMDAVSAVSLDLQRCSITDLYAMANRDGAKAMVHMIDLQSLTPSVASDSSSCGDDGGHTGTESSSLQALPPTDDESSSGGAGHSSSLPSSENVSLASSSEKRCRFDGGDNASLASSDKDCRFFGGGGGDNAGLASDKHSGFGSDNAGLASDKQSGFGSDGADLASDKHSGAGSDVVRLNAPPGVQKNNLPTTTDPSIPGKVTPWQHERPISSSSSSESGASVHSDDLFSDDNHLNPPPPAPRSQSPTSSAAAALEAARSSGQAVTAVLGLFESVVKPYHEKVREVLAADGVMEKMRAVWQSVDFLSVKTGEVFGARGMDQLQPMSIFATASFPEELFVRYYVQLLIINDLRPACALHSIYDFSLTNALSTYMYLFECRHHGDTAC